MTEVEPRSIHAELVLLLLREVGAIVAMKRLVASEEEDGGRGTLRQSKRVRDGAEVRIHHPPPVSSHLYKNDTKFVPEPRSTLVGRRRDDISSWRSKRH